MTDSATEKRPTWKHPAWRVLAGLILMQAGFTGITVNCMGVLLAAVIADMGYAASRMALFYTLRGLVSAALVAPLMGLFLRRKSRLLIALMGVIGGLCIAAGSCFTQLWQWYVAAVFSGASYSLNNVLVPNIVNNWFAERRGLASAVALSASGISGALFSPILARVIAALGWRSASVVFGLAIFVLTVLPALFLVRYAPEDCGERPLGERTLPSAGADRDREQQEQPTGGGLVFALVTIIIMVAYCGTTYTNQLPLVARSFGFSAMIGATVTSIAMVGNIGSKFLFGALCDRFGVHRAGIGAMLATALGLLLITFGKHSVGAMYGGTLLFGMVYACATVMLSLLCLASFGEKTYAKPMSRVVALAQIASAFSGPGIAAVYDYTGSFAPALIAGSVCCLLCAALLLVLLRMKRQQEGA